MWKRGSKCTARPGRVTQCTGANTGNRGEPEFAAPEGAGIRQPTDNIRLETVAKGYLRVARSSDVMEVSSPTTP